MNHFQDSIPGWFDGGYMETYQQAVAEVPDGATLVEIGAYMGKSTSFLAVEAINSGKRLRLVVVDHFQGSAEHQDDLRRLERPLREVFEENVAPVRHVLEVVQLPSVVAAHQFADGTLDFVFIDGSHDEPAVAADIAAWWPKVKAGGVLAGHDMNYTSVEAAVRAAFADVERVGGKCWRVRK